jgi:predicted nucleic acid-binding protein
MRLLLDTNVFLEILLEQQQASKARFLLSRSDDAYQYVAAEKYNLTLVSLDSDFDRTERGRQTLAQIASAIT